MMPSPSATNVMPLKNNRQYLLDDIRIPRLALRPSIEVTADWQRGSSEIAVVYSGVIARCWV